MGYAPHQSALRTASPQGEAFNIGDSLNFKQFVTVRYKTGDARPRGEAFIYGKQVAPLISPLCGQLPHGGKLDVRRLF